MTDTAAASSRPRARAAVRPSAQQRAWTGRSDRQPPFFAFLVLVILGGVIVSLVIGALPALSTFGFGFAYHRRSGTR